MSSSSGVDMARPPAKRPLRGGAGAGARGRGRGGLASPAASAPSSAGAGLATRVAQPPSDGEDLAPHSDDLLEVEDDDDIREDAAALFGIDLGDGDGSQPDPINLDADGDGGVEASTETHGISTTRTGKNKSAVWEYFHEIKENKVRVAAICKHCRTRYTARSAAGIGHLRRHMKSCMAKHNHATMT